MASQWSLELPLLSKVYLGIGVKKVGGDTSGASTALRRQA